ncbi:WAT1-related protein At5g64700 [Cannabis sativa]|uniref:WAT1-related protein At5g64700 n=1 Tax=Cannabis sativa TaxID=3483 RepID=UPI0029C9D41E|nr:WAT1-related protein At5g64700 [Cannabis sativa]
MGGVKVYLAVILSQAIYAGMVLLTKAIFNGGMNCYIFTFYRQLVGTVVLVPLALIFKRRNATPLSVLTFCKIFMLALLGVTIPINASNVAIAYTTATLGAAILNCLPVATFCLALLLRMENVTLKTTAGIVKIAGLVACVGGVVTLTFYKGPHLNPFLHHHPMEYHHPQQAHQPHISSNKRWLIGCSLFVLATFAWSLFLVLQAQILKSYPEGLRLTSLLCLTSSGQCFVFAIALERNPSEWKLGWNIELLTIIYSGILITSLSYNIQAWVVQIKGPVFIAMSQPLTLIITMIGSVLLLGEAINLGSVLGGILLVVSLYAVLWGKSKDQTLQNQSNSDNKAEADILALEEAEVKKNHYEDEIRV